MPLANIESYAKVGAVPDKAAMWTYPETSDGWYRIHNTIRAEMAKFSAGVVASTSPLDAWQVEALQAYWKGHSNLVHVHHEHEDTMFTPMLKEKVNYPEKLEADHVQLVAAMDAIEKHVAALAPGAPPDADALRPPAADQRRGAHAPVQGEDRGAARRARPCDGPIQRPV